MQRLISIVTLLGWCLWLGGLVALLLFVTRLFRVNRSIAVEAAPVLFVSFALYQLITGAAACAAGTLLAVITRRRLFAMMTLLMIAAMAVAIFVAQWTDRMEDLRHAGFSSSDSFKSLHAQTSIGYTAIAALLLTAGVGIILGISAPQTAAAALPPTDSPAEAAGRFPSAAAPVDRSRLQ
jgi:hypothetical protein